MASNLRSSGSTPGASNVKNSVTSVNTPGVSRRESINASLVNIQEKIKDKTPKTDKQISVEESELNSQFQKFRNEIQVMFKSFDESFEKRITAFEKKLSSSFEELKTELGAMKLEVYESKSDVKELKQRVRDLETSIEYQTQKVGDETSRVEDLMERYKNELEREIEEIKQQRMWQEKHDRQYNLLFYGFVESVGENLEEIMRTFFKEKLKIEEERVNKMQFANYHRLARETDGPKPIIIKFISMKDRDLVYSQLFNPVLKDEKKRILTDLPVQMKRERGRLAKAAYEIRRTEKLKTRIQEKGLSVYLEVRKDSDSAWEKRNV